MKTAVIEPYVYTTAASCSSWQVLNTTAVSPSIYTLPFFPPTLNMTVDGTLDVRRAEAVGSRPKSRERCKKVVCAPTEQIRALCSSQVLG